MTNRDSIRRRLSIHYYDGAYGPTLRIEVPSRFLIERFMRTLERLARGQDQRIELIEATNAETSDVASIDLSLVGAGHRGSLRQLKASDERPRFEWSNTSDGWQSCLELIEPFVRSFEPGHAYLTNEGSDDILVEFSYGE